MRWLASAYASARSFVTVGYLSCRFSAVMPMNSADSSTSCSAMNRGFGSTASPIGCRPMCSTPPAIATSAAPSATSPATVVTAVIAPAHIRSIAYPGTVTGRPARIAALRPIVSPWSPICVVAAMATSPIRSCGRSGLRRSSSLITRITRSSALVSA